MPWQPNPEVEDWRGRSELRVVVVDGQVLARTHVVRGLEAAGYSIVGSVGTGEATPALIRATLPDIAVLEELLPDGSGISVCSDLRRGFPSLHTVIHALTLTHAERGRAYEAGASAVVMKEVRLAPLLAALSGLRRR